MDKTLHKPTILSIKTAARSRLFHIESVNLRFSNGVERIYERMRPRQRESVMIVPIIDDDLLLISEYAVGVESYELGFPKGLVDHGESILAAANRELMEEVGFGAHQLTVLKSVMMSPAYFSSQMTLLLARDLYPCKLEGDEPEPLTLIRWPLRDIDALLALPEFNEARAMTALFMVRDWLNNPITSPVTPASHP
ncbi:MAG: ADP compounds hydrolase NudE [Plesiomonas sp.]|uniref:ADP compounds hydrolase NudE n=1 Tax=Plesiomonas sp. TaxID=2486279 RepID=UPI003F3F37FD